MMRFVYSLGLILLLVSRTQADGVNVALSASVQNSARGREIVFRGTLTNNGTTKVYLNDIATALNVGSAAALSLKPGSFFSNVPGVLLPGESYADDEIFRVALSSTASSGDYRGTVAIRGGSNIFANDALASAPFVVLSPSVTVDTIDANASEFGPDSGTWTVSRSGGTDIELAVPFATSGTAAAGLDYLSLLSPVTIPAGVSYATLTVMPIPNNIAQGDRTALVALTPSSDFNLAAQTNAAIVIHDKPVDQWRFEQFGANANDATAADEASWSGDGIANLLKFALNLDPKNGVSAGLPAGFEMGDYLALRFSPNVNATDVSFIVEGSSDLLSWSAAKAEFVSEVGPSNIVTYRYYNLISESERGFLRLRVLRTDL